MTIYRDASHAISRVMSIDMHDGTKKQQWQRHYQAGMPDAPINRMGDELSPDEQTTQDSMTRAMLKRELPQLQWMTLVAKYSISELEVQEAVRYLIPRVTTVAHHLFRTKCVTAWVIPERRNRLKPEFYQIHSWDADGTPDRTLRRWRLVMFKWLDERVIDGHQAVEDLLERDGLLLRHAA